MTNNQEAIVHANFPCSWSLFYDGVRLGGGTVTDFINNEAEAVAAAKRLRDYLVEQERKLRLTNFFASSGLWKIYILSHPAILQNEWRLVDGK